MLIVDIMGVNISNIIDDIIGSDVVGIMIWINITGKIIGIGGIGGIAGGISIAGRIVTEIIIIGIPITEINYNSDKIITNLKNSISKYIWMPNILAKILL